MHTTSKQESRRAMPHAAMYESFELNIDQLSTEISDYIHSGSTCPVILSGLGPI